MTMVFKRLFGKKGRFRGRDAHLTFMFDAKDDDGGDQFLLMSNDDDEDEDGGENDEKFGGGKKSTLDLSQDNLIIDAKIEIEEKHLKSPVSTAIPVRRFPTPTMNPDRPLLDVNFSDVFGNDDTDGQLPLSSEPVENDDVEMPAYQQNEYDETQQPKIDQEDTLTGDDCMPSEHRTGNTLRRPTMDFGGGIGNNVGLRKASMVPGQTLRRQTMNLVEIDENDDQQMRVSAQELTRPTIDHGGFYCSEDPGYKDGSSSQDAQGFDALSSKPSRSLDPKSSKDGDINLEDSKQSSIMDDSLYKSMVVATKDKKRNRRAKRLDEVIQEKYERLKGECVAGDMSACEVSCAQLKFAAASPTPQRTKKSVRKRSSSKAEMKGTLPPPTDGHIIDDSVKTTENGASSDCNSEADSEIVGSAIIDNLVTLGEAANEPTRSKIDVDDGRSKRRRHESEPAQLNDKSSEAKLTFDEDTTGLSKKAKQIIGFIDQIAKAGDKMATEDRGTTSFSNENKPKRKNRSKEPEIVGVQKRNSKTSSVINKSDVTHDMGQIEPMVDNHHSIRKKSSDKHKHHRHPHQSSRHKKDRKTPRRTRSSDPILMASSTTALRKTASLDPSNLQESKARKRKPDTKESTNDEVGKSSTSSNPSGPSTKSHHKSSNRHKHHSSKNRRKDMKKTKSAEDVFDLRPSPTGSPKRGVRKSKSADCDFRFMMASTKGSKKGDDDIVLPDAISRRLLFSAFPNDEEMMSDEASTIEDDNADKEELEFGSDGDDDYAWFEQQWQSFNMGADSFSSEDGGAGGLADDDEKGKKTKKKKSSRKMGKRKTPKRTRSMDCELIMQMRTTQ